MTQSKVMYNGREYVSVEEFANRVGSTPQTINRYIREGNLASNDIQKTGVRYLDWAMQSIAFKILIANKTVAHSHGRPKKDKIVNTFTKDSSIQAPSVKEVSVQIEDNELKEIEISEGMIDMSKLDPYEHSDCWQLDTNGIPIKTPDGEPLLNYEKLKAKITASTYSVKLAKEVGSLIPKEELLPTVQSITTIFKSAVDNIPHKYIAPVIAMCESIIGREFTAEEQTKMLNLLRNVPKEIFPSLQAELDKLAGNTDGQS